MTNLNLRKKKIRNSFIGHLVIFAVLLALLPWAIHLFVESLEATYYSKGGGGIFVWIVCLIVLLTSFIRWLSIYIKFRKINFPTEEIHTVDCKKITLRNIVWMRFLKIKTKEGNFLYISPSDMELSSAQLREKYQKQTITLKCYAATKFVKEIKL